MKSLPTNGMSLHGKYSTLVVVEPQSVFSELLQQGINLSVLEFADLLLPLVHHAADSGQQDVPWLDDRDMPGAEMGQCPVATDEIRPWKSKTPASRNALVFHVLSSAEFFTLHAQGNSLNTNKNNRLRQTQAVIKSGGGGNRTPVLLLLDQSLYVRSPLIKSHGRGSNEQNHPAPVCNRVLHQQ